MSQPPQGGEGGSKVGDGPSVVALGGGHGLAVTLSAISRYAGQVTAVVSVADDGGSSGRLRATWPGPAPGDVRRCLLALAGDEPGQRLWARALDHRFSTGELAGHSLGNLVLMALAELTGDFIAAAAEVGRLLGVKARVLPATLGPVDLCAEVVTPGGPVVIEGQAKVTHSPAPVHRVWLRPESPAVPAEVLDAIASADQVVLGPGSLFTSVLAVCAVPAIRLALSERAAGRVYVCNLASGDGEASGLDADAHLGALAAHGVVVDAAVFDPASEVGAPDLVRAGTASLLSRGYGAEGAGKMPRGGNDGEQVSAGGQRRDLGEAALLGPSGQRARIVKAALAGADGRSHDPACLAKVLAELAAGDRAAVTELR